MPEVLNVLLGAGASCAYNFPTSDELTGIVLDGEGFRRNTLSEYDRGMPIDIRHDRCPHVLEITRFLSLLCEDARVAFNGLREPNYEDIYHLALTIYDFLSGEYPYADSRAFVEKLRPLLSLLVHELSRKTSLDMTLKQFVWEALTYIECVVCVEINERTGNLRDPINHLSFLVDGVQSEQLKRINVFTLNHDTLIEQFWEQHNIEFTDGFGNVDGDLRKLNPVAYDNATRKLNLYKLHGSINWYRLRPEAEGSWYNEVIAIPVNGDVWHATDATGVSFHPLPANHGMSHPMILVGSENKLRDYNGGVWIELQHRFRQSLFQSNHLIISGYSFADKGINNRIIEWVYRSRDNKIIVIHPNPDELHHGALGAISNKWEMWLNSDTLRLIEMPIERCTWNDIEQRLA